MVSFYLIYMLTCVFRSQLTSIVFGHVRDGYYSELRRLRRVSNSTTGSAKELEEPPKEEVAADDDQVFR
jgi:hypothetical protein